VCIEEAGVRISSVAALVKRTAADKRNVVDVKDTGGSDLAFSFRRYTPTVTESLPRRW